MLNINFHRDIDELIFGIVIVITELKSYDLIFLKLVKVIVSS